MRTNSSLRLFRFTPETDGLATRQYHPGRAQTSTVAATATTPISRVSVPPLRLLSLSHRSSAFLSPQSVPFSCVNPDLRISILQLVCHFVIPFTSLRRGRSITISFLLVTKRKEATATRHDEVRRPSPIALRLPRRRRRRDHTHQAGAGRPEELRRLLLWCYDAARMRSSSVDVNN